MLDFDCKKADFETDSIKELKMYDPGEDFGHDGHEDEFGHEDEDSEEIQNELWQEACWIVISADFEEKGE